MRIRTIKPEFWKSEKIASLSYQERLLFIGLWGLADDYGRFRAHPSLIRGELFAYDSKADVAAWLASLVDLGVVRLYTHDGQSYGVVTNFAEHQKIDKRTASKLPEPPPDSAEKLAEPTEPLAESADFLPRKGTGKGKEQGKEQGDEGVPPLDDSLAGFDQFWATFDHKQARPQAEKAWRRIKPSAELVALIVERAGAYAAATPDRQFRKHPATWLNGRCWDDDLPTPRHGKVGVARSAPVGSYLAAGESNVQTF